MVLPASSVTLRYQPSKYGSADEDRFVVGETLLLTRKRKEKVRKESRGARARARRSRRQHAEHRAQTESQTPIRDFSAQVHQEHETPDSRCSHVLAMKRARPDDASGESRQRTLVATLFPTKEIDLSAPRPQQNTQRGPEEPCVDKQVFHSTFGVRTVRTSRVRFKVS